jgi:hypothetical protein
LKNKQIEKQKEKNFEAKMSAKFLKNKPIEKNRELSLSDCFTPKLTL